MYSRARMQDADTAIRLTDIDAAVARLSAAEKQYFHDPFVKTIVPRAQVLQPRPPLINVGTYLRTQSIDDLVQNWLTVASNTGSKCQIISLGAGSDTRFWRLETGPYRDLVARYIEIDFPEVTTKKTMCIKRNPDLARVLGTPEELKLGRGGVELHTPKYHLLAADLREDPSELLQTLLTTTPEYFYGPILSPRVPTLLLCECVLVYMPLDHSSRLIRWFANYFTSGNEAHLNAPLGCIIYEMFGLDDSFGRVMLHNLKIRNVSLPGAEPMTRLELLVDRILNNGFHQAQALTLKDIWHSYIAPAELRRISRIEFLDETEELDLVLSHYALTWGLLLPNPADREIWGHWGLTERAPPEERSVFD